MRLFCIMWVFKLNLPNKLMLNSFILFVTVSIFTVAKLKNKLHQRVL